MKKLISLVLKRTLKAFSIFFIVLSIGMFIFWLISPRVFFNFLFMKVFVFLGALATFHEAVVPESRDNYPSETRALVERVESMTHQECEQLIKTKNLTGLVIDFEKLYDEKSPSGVANLVLFPNILKITKDPVDVHCIMLSSGAIYTAFQLDSGNTKTSGAFYYRRHYSYHPLNLWRFPSYWQIVFVIKPGPNGKEVLDISTGGPAGTTL